MTRSEVCGKLAAVYAAKNKDYGNSAHQTYLEFGEVALVIRISDKFSRLQSLLESGEQNVKDESIFDTMGDAITYLAMLIAEIECDIEDAPEGENIETVRSTLEDLGLCDVAYDATIEDGQFYREWLIEIYKGVLDARDRADEYYHLADTLLDQYILMMEEKDDGISNS